jgi:hypothetical protein
MQMPNNREIKINPQGWIVNSDARTPASKSASDTVTWRALGQGGPWRVVFFSTSPFAESTFVVPQGGTVGSGEITASPTTFPVKFRYEVQDNSGKVIDDPDVIIEA